MYRAKCRVLGLGFRVCICGGLPVYRDLPKGTNSTPNPKPTAPYFGPSLDCQALSRFLLACTYCDVCVSVAVLGGCTSFASISSVSSGYLEMVAGSGV